MSNEAGRHSARRLGRFTLHWTFNIGYQAGRNLQNNGWYNPKPCQTRPPVANPLNANSTLAELMHGVPDEAMIHLTPAPASSFASGAHQTSWARFGDVKHMTVAEFKFFVVGPQVPRSTAGSNLFVVKLPTGGKFDASVFEARPAINWARVTEYWNRSTVDIDMYVQVAGQSSN